MAKELPYFRFEPSEWDNGNIQMCSRESKGLFIDLCSLYWSRLGELPYALALQKLCNGNELALQELKNNDIFGVLNGQIVIDFLDEQLSERGQVSEKRRNAAQKRWNDASALQVQSKSNANRIEENRKEKKIKEDNQAVLVNELPFGSDAFILAWSEWCEHRTQLKKKLTPKTKEMQLRTLGAKTELEAINMINQSIGNGWTGLFELKQQNNGKSNGTPKTFDKDKLARLINERYGITGTAE
jgi:hypothetical protein